MFSSEQTWRKSKYNKKIKLYHLSINFTAFPVKGRSSAIRDQLPLGERPWTGRQSLTGLTPTGNLESLINITACLLCRWVCAINKQSEVGLWIPIFHYIWKTVNIPIKTWNFPTNKSSNAMTQCEHVEYYGRATRECMKESYSCPWKGRHTEFSMNNSLGSTAIWCSSITHHISCDVKRLWLISLHIFWRL